MNKEHRSKTPIFDIVAGPQRLNRKYIEIDADGEYRLKAKRGPGIKRALSRDAQIRGFTPDAFTFWRNIAVLFCMFSVVGHWMECGYCALMELGFDVIAQGYPVWDDPMYPYLVYGIATVVCTLLLMPLKIEFLQRSRTLLSAVLKLFIVTVFVCMLMELSMGLLLNQPDPVTGVYPLWDNSKLPLNILGQAWLVNDVFLGFAASLYVWVIYPVCLWLISLVPPRAMNVVSALMIVCFVILCIVKFS